MLLKSISLQGLVKAVRFVVLFKDEADFMAIIKWDQHLFFLIFFELLEGKIYSVQNVTLKPITAGFIFRFLRSTLKKPNIGESFPPELVYIGSDP